MLRMQKTAADTDMWDTPQTFSVAQSVPQGTPGCSRARNGKWKIEKAWYVMRLKDGRIVCLGLER